MQMIGEKNQEFQNFQNITCCQLNHKVKIEFQKSIQSSIVSITDTSNSVKRLLNTESRSYMRSLQIESDDQISALMTIITANSEKSNNEWQLLQVRIHRTVRLSYLKGI